MKAGTEDRRKLFAAVGFGVLALGYLGYTLIGSSGDSPPPPTPAATTAVPARTGAAARNTAHVSASHTDVSLHPEGMELAESLVYAGKGRNIFAAPTAAPLAAALPKIPKPAETPRYVPPTPVNTGPPPPPPIDLRYFGTALLSGGRREAFLLKGDDVFVAAAGDIVNRRYRIGQVTARDVEVTDLANNNTQRLPITSQ